MICRVGKQVFRTLRSILVAIGQEWVQKPREDMNSLELQMVSKPNLEKCGVMWAHTIWGDGLDSQLRCCAL